MTDPTSVQDLGPLDWRIGIVDQQGRPTPEFQRKWNSQRQNNALITSVTLGSGPPTDPTQPDGAEYIDVTADPAVLYVSDGGIWVRVGVATFTQLSDVPASYTGQMFKLVRVNITEDGLEFAGITDILDLIGATQGDILYRDASSWTVLAPGTAGFVLSTNGTGNNPTWIAAGGGGGGGGGLPLVNGDTPGPGVMADPHGQTIFVAI